MRSINLRFTYFTLMPRQSQLCCKFVRTLLRASQAYRLEQAYVFFVTKTANERWKVNGQPSLHRHCTYRTESRQLCTNLFRVTQLFLSPQRDSGNDKQGGQLKEVSGTQLAIAPTLSCNRNVLIWRQQDCLSASASDQTDRHTHTHRERERERERMTNRMSQESLTARQRHLSMVSIQRNAHLASNFTNTHRHTFTCSSLFAKHVLRNLSTQATRRITVANAHANDAGNDVQ